MSGKAGQHALLFALGGVKAARVLVVGLGDRHKFDAAAFSRAAHTAGRALKSSPVAAAASWLTELDVPGRDLAWKLRTAALAADQQAYRYTATFSSKEAARTPTLTSTPPPAAMARAHSAEAEAIALGVRFARELGNLPPNIYNWAYMAAQAQALADNHDGVSCEILDRDAMDALGMGSLLAVARGSANAPKLIVLRWNGRQWRQAVWVLVGKGITFDSGGISIKPGAGMEEMKFDMGGAAGVLVHSPLQSS